MIDSIKCDLSRDFTNLKIYPFSDWHIGDSLCDRGIIDERINIVKNEPNSYCVINGDMLNWASKTSVSDIYGERLKPMEQLGVLETLLDPIKDKILFMTAGNHEGRAYRTEGIELLAITAKELGISNVYRPIGATLFVRFGEDIRKEPDNVNYRRILYTLYVLHGSGGGRKEGAKANRLAEMASIVNADIFVHSHTHMPMILRGARFNVNTCNSTVIKEEMLFVNTGATLDYGGYGQTYEFKPSSKATPVIHLDGKKKRFYATL